MGGKLSKDTASPSGATKDTTAASIVPKTPANDEAINIPIPESETKGAEVTESKCPMKRKGGIGGYIGGSLFSASQCPHKSKHPKKTESNDNAAAAAKTTSSEQSDGCPVLHKSSTASSSTSTDGCPIKAGNNGKQQQQYNVYSQPIDPTNNMPAVANQLPAATQTENLSTERVKSNIPKGGTNGETWTYPSAQMFYNSLVRKQKLGDTEESDIESVVAIHNNMNEKTWSKVVEWEEVIAGNNNDTNNGEGGPRLLKFMGRPSDLSPKARIKNLLLGYPLPFDRHDWTIVRPDGTEVRYIIDYYHDESAAKETEESAMPKLNDREAVKSVLVDVRPALDSVGNLVDRSVVMPYARHVAKSTKFEPLSMMPTQKLKEQVGESEKVWESIQRNVQESKNRKKQQDGPKSMVLTRDEIRGREEITEEEAKEIAKNFAGMIQRCKDARMLMDQCEDESDCAKASMALSTCMAKLVCPVQYGAFADVINSEEPDENDEKAQALMETKFETTYKNMVLCVDGKTEEVAAAKEAHPNAFE